MKELEWSCRETVPLIFVYYHSEKEGDLVKHSACYESQKLPPSLKSMGQNLLFYD